jgi:hypothetical protein
MGVVLLIAGLVSIGIFFFYVTVQSEILISDRMSEFIDTVDHHKAKIENKLIVFDLDDTLFVSLQLLGTPTWFYNMVNLLRQSGAAQYEAYTVVSMIDKVIQEKIPVAAIEQATLSAIRAWQNLGITVIALTSRSKDVVHITKMQLDQIGLDFSSPYFSCVEDLWGEHESVFIDGVVFSGSNLAKGKAFGYFLEQILRCGMIIDLIAQADDQQVEKKNRIDFVGIIYGGALSSRVFDLSEAKKQLLNLEAGLDIPLIPHEYRRIFIDDHQ